MKIVGPTLQTWTFFLHDPWERPKSIYPRKTFELPRKLLKNIDNLLKRHKTMPKWTNFYRITPKKAFLQKYIFVDKKFEHLWKVLPDKLKLYTTIGCTVPHFCTYATLWYTLDGWIVNFLLTKDSCLKCTCNVCRRFEGCLLY